ncbi:MAG: glycosyltransferase family 4 protein [Bryobacterales bacterium]|nr:glycosyltransferase family 4 protein [Bryobacterales bacterium]
MPVRIAIIFDSVTPYRLVLHRRIAREFPEVDLYSLFTHNTSNAPWKLKVDPELKPVYFGRGHDGAGRPLLQEWKKGGQMTRWLRDHQIQAVVLGGYNDTGRLRILAWTGANRIPCFIFGDSNSRADVVRGWKRWLKRVTLPYVLAQASGVMYCGVRGQEYFSSYGVPSERMFPFPYEADYHQLAGVSATVANTAKCRLGLASTKRILLFSGRLTGVKRPELLLEAFSRIQDRRPEWHLVFAGGGPLQAALEEEVARRPMSRVHFTGFINDPSVLASFYAASDVLVLPSSYEPWGVVVTEAAVHCALVCSDVVGAAADLVQEDHNGYLFPSGSLDGLVTALLRATDPANVDRLKAASPGVLAAWRARTDPIRGLRQALRFSGLLK